MTPFVLTPTIKQRQWKRGGGGKLRSYRGWLIWALLALGLGGCFPQSDQELPPTAVFTVEPPEVHAGEEVLFDAAASRAAQGEIVRYQWDFGDGHQAEGVRVTHVYSAVGTYTVRLTVTDERGRQGQALRELNVLPEVNPPPPGGPRAAFTAEPWEGPAPLTVTFDASASTGQILRYAWDFGDGAVLEVTNPIVQHTYTEPGQYWVELTVTDAAGLSHSAQRRVSVRAQGGTLVAEFTVTPNNFVGDRYVVMVGEEVSLDASPSTGNIVSYRWDFGDGASAEGKVVTHAFQASGEYTVRLTVADPGGATASVSKVFLVVAPPAPPG